jgi:hypothetical protein
MKETSKKNPAPLAPTSAAPGNAAPHKVAPVEKGTLVKNKNTAAGDPTKEAKPSRSNVLLGKERSGARHGIRVKFQKTVAPEAGAIQGNGRLVPPSVNRSRANFKSGEADLN